MTLASYTYVHTHHNGVNNAAFYRMVVITPQNMYFKNQFSEKPILYQMLLISRLEQVVLINMLGMQAS